MQRFLLFLSILHLIFIQKNYASENITSYQKVTTQSNQLKNQKTLFQNRLNLKDPQNFQNIEEDHVEEKLNAYYTAKNEESKDTERILKDMVAHYPDNLTVLKEAGYFYINANQTEEALFYFLKVEELTPEDQDITIQIAYLLEKLGRRKEAFDKFKLAFDRENDPNKKQEIYNSMLNLSEWSMKYLPDPLFFDVYYAPTYLKRFHNFIQNGNLRFGAQKKEWFNVEAYTIFRFNQDSRSKGGKIAVIFEDNYNLYGIGLSFQPLSFLPLRLYMEGGYAEDTKKRNRSTWRRDFRTGGILYSAWGEKPVFRDSFEVTFHHIGNIYDDCSYFFRYKNIINFMRIREGARILRYKFSHIDVYLNAQGTVDTQKEFYNNIIEVGPGFSLAPYNLYNINLRMDFLRGAYIRRGTATSNNPYKRYYNNCVFLFEVYKRF